MDHSLQRLHGFLIAIHISEVAVKLSQDREMKVMACKDDNKKGIPDLLGSNLTYLLHIGQVATHEGACGGPEVPTPDNTSEGSQQHLPLPNHPRP